MATSKETLQLQNKIKELEERLELKDKLNFSLNESIPTDQVGRKKYVADVAFFYSVIFKDKLKHFIGLQMEELARIGRTEVGSDIVRSNINCFRLIDEWMLKMNNEHIGNIQDIRNRFNSDKDIVNEMKKIYG